jgi:hypothetical protein
MAERLEQQDVRTGSFRVRRNCGNRANSSIIAENSNKVPACILLGNKQASEFQIEQQSLF